MRIAYVSLHWPRTASSGVGQKILQQISSWRAAEHEVSLFMHLHSSHADRELLSGATFEYRQGSGLAGKIKQEFSRSAALKNLLNAVASFQPHLIYMRFDYYVFPLHQFFQLAPVVFEINTHDVYEHHLWSTALGAYSRITRSISLKRAAGLVCVSHELAGDRHFSRFDKPARIIANGYDIHHTRPFDAPHNTTPRLVFIAGDMLPWHGVDKLVYLARTYPDILIDVVGYSPLSAEKILPPNMSFYGFLTAAQYLKVLASADVAIGTLALHRKKMDEASPLKTRECLAYGLPLVMPYRDTDLDDIECDFLLKIPNQEDNIISHGRAIHDFAYQMRGQRVDLDVIAERIDSRKKEVERLDFFDEIVSVYRSDR